MGPSGINELSANHSESGLGLLHPAASSLTDDGDRNCVKKTKHFRFHIRLLNFKGVVYS